MRAAFTYSLRQHSPCDAKAHAPGVLLTGVPLLLSYQASVGAPVPLHCTVELLHTSDHLETPDEDIDALAALFSHVLPAIPAEDIAADLRRPNSYSFVVFRSHQDVIDDWNRTPQRLCLRARRADVPVLPSSTAATQSRLPDSEADSDVDVDSDSDSDLFSNATDSDLIALPDPRAPTAALPAPTRRDRIVGAVSVTLLPPNAHQAAFADPEQPFAPERVLHLAYVGVRCRFQGLKLGRRLVATAIDAHKHGDSDVLLTHAGTDAVPFFTHCGFSADPILTQPYTAMDQQWADAVLMLHRDRRAAAADPDAALSAFRARHLSLYAADLRLVESLTGEVARLREDNRRLVMELRRSVAANAKLLKQLGARDEPPASALGS
jgi:ribosomal protein S18 acetylase RimI-like enzyme